MTLARMLSLCGMSPEANPARSRSTMKPMIPSGPLAQTIATSATCALVIQSLRPETDQPFAVRTARVSIPPGSLPCSGSVRPKHPITSPAAIFGSHFCFCASEP